MKTLLRTVLRINPLCICIALLLAVLWTPQIFALEAAAMPDEISTSEDPGYSTLQTVIAAALTALLAAIGIPAALVPLLSLLIGALARVVVPAIEQKLRGKPGPIKKEAAVAELKKMLPALLHALPRTKALIDLHIEAQAGKMPKRSVSDVEHML